MNVKIFLEHRFKRTPDGRVWSPIFAYETWGRYLRVFSQVTLCARVIDVPSVGADMSPSTGERVGFLGLPYYHGPRQYLAKRGEVNAAVARLITPDDAYIIRVPGNVANVAVNALKKAGVPYAVEVVADPWDMFSPGSSTHPLRWFFRRMFTRSLRRQCAEAAVSLYVTEEALQRRYPPKIGSQSFHASNVYLAQPKRTSTHAVSDACLANAAFVPEPRPSECFAAKPMRFVCVGSFNLLYKAQDVLVKSFARTVRNGLDGHLSFVGDGVYRGKIEALAARHPELKGRVEFLGQLRGGAGVREVLDRSHIFVLPSRQEGLPRAALEAMARGLPCIGSDVGGFPEILPSDAIVPVNDVARLADCMIRLSKNPARLVEMSAANLIRAADFHAEKLALRQTAYYSAVLDVFNDHWSDHGSTQASNSTEGGPAASIPALATETRHAI